MTANADLRFAIDNLLWKEEEDSEKRTSQNTKKCGFFTLFLEALLLLRHSNVLLVFTLCIKREYLGVEGGAGSSVGIATDYLLEGPGSKSVYNVEASRKGVGERCSVYVAECSESNSWVRGVFTSVV